MNTTIYLPMPEWQALSFLRNRDQAFERLLTPAGNHLPCEVMLVEDGLFGFKTRDNAVEIGKRVYPHGFAVVRIVVLGKVLNGVMTLQRQITGTTDPGSGYALWRLNRDGLATVWDKLKSGDTEILVDQIFGGDHDHNVDRCAAPQSEEVDRGFLEDGGRPAGFQPRLADLGIGGVGPTGFGC